jgi:chloramphenicol-sensitive protein RarD
MQAKNEDSLSGLGFALSAYLMWGFLPLYMKAVDHFPPTEVIAHRVIWSIPVAFAVLLATGRTRDLKAALLNPRMLAMGVVTASLIGINWGFYIWAITSGNAMEAALGYYINPLFSIFLAAVFLRERLSTAQWSAIALSVAAVVVLTVEAGRLPAQGLVMTLTWGLYAYFKKSLPIGPNQAFTLEILLLTPFALAYITYLIISGESHFLTETTRDTWLLLGAGPVSAIPLIIYANGAKRLRLSTIGILQYVAPTLIFLVAVFIFHEPFGQAQLIAFSMIWTALVIYTVSMLRGARKAGR